MEILKYGRIRDIRVDRNLTQTQVAELLHISQNTYSQYEIGITRYPLEAVVTLAEYYNVSVDYLVGLTDEPAPCKKSGQKEPQAGFPPSRTDMKEQKIKQDVCIGANIRAARRQRGLRQAELVRLLELEGVSITREALVKIEKGTQHIRASQLRAIRDALHTTYEALLE